MTGPVWEITPCAGMTHGAVKAAFAACWPLLRLHLYWPTNAYYKEDWRAEDAQTGDDDILHPHRSEQSVSLTGSMTISRCHRLLHDTFNLESEITYLEQHAYVRGETIDDCQRHAARWSDLFEALNGRPPGPLDWFDWPP